MHDDFLVTVQSSNVNIVKHMDAMMLNYITDQRASYVYMVSTACTYATWEKQFNKRLTDFVSFRLNIYIHTYYIKSKHSATPGGIL